MRFSLGAAAVTVALALGAACAACAQTAPPATAPASAPPAGAAAPPAKSVAPSVDWTIQDLLADPAAKEVIDRDLPGLETDPRLDVVKAMSLRAVAQYPEAQIDPAKLDSVQSDLLSLAKPAS